MTWLIVLLAVAGVGIGIIATLIVLLVLVFGRLRNYDARLRELERLVSKQVRAGDKTEWHGESHVRE